MSPVVGEGLQSANLYLGDFAPNTEARPFAEN